MEASQTQAQSVSDTGASDIDNNTFYSNAEEYWKDIPATVDGMLGGFAHISSTDIAGSTKFLNYFIRPPHGKTAKKRALDCGAGIGRISKRLLLPAFEQVDLVELNPEFLKEARNYLTQYSSKVDRYICSGLQNFTPDAGRYDIIWCQWVLGHLTDDDFVAFFKRCREGLSQNGLIIVKENVVSTNSADFDDKDSSYTRPRELLLELFKKAELTIIKEEKQKRFPKEIYDVIMFALR